MSVNPGRLAAAALAVLAISGRQAPGPRFERVYALAPQEGVFAYSRISPDGQRLAYASEVGERHRTITVVDLPTERVLFREAGIDAYWSRDGQRLIFLSQQDGVARVSIRHQDSGAIARDVAPVNLGDYYSWGVRDGREIILTIRGRYFFLDGDRGVMPAASVPPCEGSGTGARPLLSKDGRRISTFVEGALVIRNLTDCNDVVETGIGGAKADFSWDGRYVAFHMPKRDLSGYQIAVIDLIRKTIRAVTDLPGSSLFPSWTADGRLSFRYDSDDYRGFVMADRVLDAPERPWPAPVVTPEALAWRDVFPETPLPPHPVNVVTVWASWSAHSSDALLDLQRADRSLRTDGADVGVFTATDPGSRRADLDRLIERYGISLPEIALAHDRFRLTEAHNQVPATLLFKGGRLIDRRLGAQTTEQLQRWIAQMTND
jgi:hypothetical protein